MEFKREIPKIGQGCFIEQIMNINKDSYRIIYDCGSFQKEILKQYINLMDHDIPTTLVISHFHEDHINCIPYLIKSGIKINKLIIPNLSKEILKLFAASISEDDIEAIDFILNPENYSDNVSYLIKGENNEENERNNLISSKTLKDNRIYDITENYNLWSVKFWIDNDVYSNLAEYEVSEISKFDINDFKDRTKLKEIKDIYRTISKDTMEKLNRTSMIMGTFINYIDRKLSLPLYYLTNDYNNNYNYLERIGFICTGDYPINSKEAKKDIMEHYLKQQLYFKEMMLPHHGSNKYFDYLPFGFIKQAYAQNTKNRTYGHPGNETLMNLNKWKINFKNIQEN